MNNSIFSEIAIDNNLTADELDEVVNSAFETLQAKVIDFFKKYEKEVRGKKTKYTYRKYINGIVFLIKKSKNYSAEFYVGDTDNSEILDMFKLGEFWDNFEKEIFPDILLTFKMELSEKNKIYKSVFEIEKEVIEYLKRNSIEYKYIQASTGTVYIETAKGKIRIADHTGLYRQYSDVVLYLFNQKYDVNEIDDKLNNIFSV